MINENPNFRKLKESVILNRLSKLIESRSWIQDAVEFDIVDNGSTKHIKTWVKPETNKKWSIKMGPPHYEIDYSDGATLTNVILQGKKLSDFQIKKSGKDPLINHAIFKSPEYTFEFKLGKNIGDNQKGAQAELNSLNLDHLFCKGIHKSLFDYFKSKGLIDKDTKLEDLPLSVFSGDESKIKPLKDFPKGGLIEDMFVFQSRSNKFKTGSNPKPSLVASYKKYGMFPDLNFESLSDDKDLISQIGIDVADTFFIIKSKGDYFLIPISVKDGETSTIVNLGLKTNFEKIFSRFFKKRGGPNFNLEDIKNSPFKPIIFDHQNSFGKPFKDLTDELETWSNKVGLKPDLESASDFLKICYRFGTIDDSMGLPNYFYCKNSNGSAIVKPSTAFEDLEVLSIDKILCNKPIGNKPVIGVYFQIKIRLSGEIFFQKVQMRIRDQRTKAFAMDIRPIN